MPDTVWMAYVSDNGTTYQRRTYADLAAAVGNTVEAAGAHVRLPSNIKPRYILGQSPAGVQRKLVVGGPTNALFVGGDNSVDVPDPDTRSTATVTLNVMGRVAEKRYAR